MPTAEQRLAYRSGEPGSMVSKPIPGVSYAVFSFVVGGFLVLGAFVLHLSPEPVASALWLAGGFTVGATGGLVLVLGRRRPLSFVLPREGFSWSNQRKLRRRP